MVTTKPLLSFNHAEDQTVRIKALREAYGAALAAGQERLTFEGQELGTRLAGAALKHLYARFGGDPWRGLRVIPGGKGD